MTKAYTIEGDFQMGRVRQPFTLEVVAADEDAARERVLAELGSRHGVSRREVRLGAVRPLDAEQASPITRHRLKG